MHADLSMLWRKEPCFSTHLLKWAMCASSAPDLQLFLRQGKAVKGICPKRTAWAAWSAAAQTALNICVLSADMQTNIAGPLEVESRQHHWNVAPCMPRQVRARQGSMIICGSSSHKSQTQRAWSSRQELARFDAVETRSIPEFRWSFYQTDGWEGYQDTAPAAESRIRLSAARMRRSRRF